MKGQHPEHTLTKDRAGTPKNTKFERGWNSTPSLLLCPRRCRSCRLGTTCCLGLPAIITGLLLILIDTKPMHDERLSLLLEPLFARIDSDGSGKLSFEEWFDVLVGDRSCMSQVIRTVPAGAPQRKSGAGAPRNESRR